MFCLVLPVVLTSFPVGLPLWFGGKGGAVTAGGCSERALGLPPSPHVDLRSLLTFFTVVFKADTHYSFSPALTGVPSVEYRKER